MNMSGFVEKIDWKTYVPSCVRGNGDKKLFIITTEELSERCEKAAKKYGSSLKEHLMNNRF